MPYPRIIVLAFLMLFFHSCQKDAAEKNLPPGALGPLDSVSFELGGVPVEIEIAYTQQEQIQGLMYRDSLPDNHGMLFVNREPRYLSFWMKNTRIPLSIAFIREDGVISNIEEMKASPGGNDPVERYYSKYQCLYALEMNPGWFQKHGFKEGDSISLPLEKIDQVITNKMH